ncbi:DUF4870 family protein [Allorhizobium sp. NPDC080224]|uniref:DUF4870 family protein n=1 Tax=Allorhizobium sp. NPDC080224 TaxID=3390547 RepID=UPI003CFD89EC
MTDPQYQPPATSGGEGWFSPGRLNVQVVYVLYLVSFVIGLTGIVGLIMAYVNRGKGAPWLDTHYTYAIRTVWLTLLYLLLSAFILVRLFVVVAIAFGFLAMVLFVVRCVIGLQKASAGEPIARPTSWWI